MNCDTCVNDIEQDKKLIDYMIIEPVHFTSKYFITKYYKILNLNQLLDWMHQHINILYETKKRVFEHGMIVYGDQLHIIDYRFSTFINSLFIDTNNIMYIYDKIKQYILVKDKQISLTNIEHKQKHTNIEQIIYYIKEIILGNDNINKFTTKFIKYYNTLLNTPNLIDKMLDIFVEYTLKKIKLTSQ